MSKGSKTQLYRALAIPLLAVGFETACSQGASPSVERGMIVHTAKGSGRWYPGGRQELEADVRRYLQQARPPRVEGRIVAVIAPHAGFQYSGPVAGYAFRAVADQARTVGAPDVVVVLGFSHSRSFTGLALMEGEAIETPLGLAMLDTETGRTLTQLSSRIFFRYVLHGNEHSAENEIPFVQMALPGVKLVVGIYGEHDPREGQTVNEVVRALAEVAKTRRALLVASTDLCHHPDYERVRRTDRATLDAIVAMKDDAAVRQCVEEQGACGALPVLTAMRFAALQGCRQGILLHYRNSGDEYPESRGHWVVGYGAVAFPVPPPAQASP